MSTLDHPCSYMYDTDTSEPNTVQLLCYTASHLCSRPSVLNVMEMYTVRGKRGRCGDEEMKRLCEEMMR